MTAKRMLVICRSEAAKNGDSGLPVRGSKTRDGGLPLRGKVCNGNGG